MAEFLANLPVFHVIEVGSGDGALARSILACLPAHDAPVRRGGPYYVAADYEPGWGQSTRPEDLDWAETGNGGSRRHPQADQRHDHRQYRGLEAEGLGAFRNIVGCILCNELIDNFPVHRFAIEDGQGQGGLRHATDGAKLRRSAG